jgi:hypothetical protein
VHAVLDEHDTPKSTAYTPGLGVARRDQRVPFQRSAIVLGVEAPLQPTAMHELVEIHETLLSTLARGAGFGSIDHLVPFHSSANPAVRRPSGGASACPTLMHQALDLQDTALSDVARDKPGLGGAGIGDHFAPCQRSAMGTPSPPPTAIHAVLDGHDTPVRLLENAWAGAVGTACTCQPKPSHLAATGRLFTALPGEAASV